MARNPAIAVTEVEEIVAPAPSAAGRATDWGAITGGLDPEPRWGVRSKEMLSLVLTVLILIGVYFLQQGHPLLAGFAAVAPVKIIAASIMTFEEGGLERLHDVIGGMLIGQVTWGAVLLAVWFALK